VVNSALNLVSLVFVVTIAIGTGLLIFRQLKLGIAWSGEVLVVSAGFGFIAIVYGTAALGAVSLLKSTPIYAWSALLALLAVLGFWHWKPRSDDGERADANLEWELRGLWGRWPLLVLGAIGVVMLLSAMTPPLEGDTLHSYLEVPRRYVDAGRFIDQSHELLASLPLNMQMLSAFALLFRGDELAQMLTGFTMAAGGVAALVVIGRRYFSTAAGVLAALFFLSTHTVEYLVPTAKINLGWLFFDLLAIYSICRWAFDNVRRDCWLLVAGIFSGAAVGSAYMGGLTAAILTTFIVGRSFTENRLVRQSLALLLRRLVLFSGPILLLAAPWLIKSFVETGNPVHPFLSSVFAGFAYDKRAADTGLLGAFRLLWDMSTQFAPYPYGKPIGPVFLVLLPMIVFVRRGRRAIWLAFAFIATYYVLWYLFAMQRPRNMLTAVAVWALVAGYFLVLLRQRHQLMARLFVSLFAIYVLFEFSFYARLHFLNLNKLSYVAGIVDRSEFLDRNLTLYPALPSFPMITYINEQLPQNSRIAAMYTGNGYYVRPVFIDSRMLGDYWKSPAPTDAEGLIRTWRQNEITHVFTNDEYPPRDPSEGPPDVLLLNSAEFRNRYLREEFADGAQHLYGVVYGVR
jgi:hypothetical protein